MNNKGQLGGWEAVIIILIFIYAGFATYKWATKPSEANIYKADSKPQVNDIKVSPFSCVRVSEEKGWLASEPTSNKVSH